MPSSPPVCRLGLLPALVVLFASTTATVTCASSAARTPAQQAEIAERRLRSMDLADVRRECETPTVSEAAWFKEHQLQVRYRNTACQRASILEQRRWFAKVPCDELRRRLFHDVPYRPDVPSARTLRLRMWECQLVPAYFDRFDLEFVRNEPELTKGALAALAKAGHPVVDALTSYLTSSADPFGGMTTRGGIYNGFRGMGQWLGSARPERCLEAAAALLPALDTDARRPAEAYRGLNGIIQGLLEGRCYEGMSLLAAREVKIRVQRAVRDGRTSELTRCKWLGRHGTPEGREDLEALFSDAKLRTWIEKHSPNCLFALDKVRAPRAPKHTK